MSSTPFTTPPSAPDISEPGPTTTLSRQDRLTNFVINRLSASDAESVTTIRWIPTPTTANPDKGVWGAWFEPTQAS